jgi:hypothetical protein
MKKKSPKPKLTRKQDLALRRMATQLKRAEAMIDKLPDGINAKHRAALKGLVGAIKATVKLCKDYPGLPLPQAIPC